VLLVDLVERLEVVVFMLLAPQSTLVADALLTGLTIDTHLLSMDAALGLLWAAGRQRHLLLHSMKIIQHLNTHTHTHTHIHTYIHTHRTIKTE